MKITVHHYSTASSTNTLAKEYAKAGAKAGTVILSDEQTKGYGKQGRFWYSPPGNLYFSLIVKPPIEFAPSYPDLSRTVCLGIQKAIHEVIPNISLTLKAPNDILIDNKKLAGILIENEPEAMIIGIGLNISFNPENIDQPTTKLNDFSTKALLKEDLLPILIKQIINAYNEWIEGLNQAF